MWCPMGCVPPASRGLTLGLILLIVSQITVTSGTRNGCRFPGSPAHSTVDFSNDTLGLVATYTCERGFELLGPSRRLCKDGVWDPEGIPFCVLNVATGKAPMQVSTEEGGIPQKAIDGSSSKDFNIETCTLTKPEKMPWWYVNLLEPYMVQLVRLDFGRSCCGANQPATIVVRVGNNRPDLGTNNICNRYTGFLEADHPLFLPCNPPMPGAFVSVHLEVPHGEQQLSICEAFVYTDQALPIERCPYFRDQPIGTSATYNGKCYYFYSQNPLSFMEARQFCTERGGTLVDESNPALQGFISWELWRKHRADSRGQYWMGAIKDGEGWKWINGEPVVVSFWNLPAGHGRCARFDGARGWLWSESDCNRRLNYICQHQPKACGRPEQPPNSTMTINGTPNYDVGSTVEYRCDEGHVLSGPMTRTCLETGFFNEFPPVCKRIQCGYPADIPNGQYVLKNDSVGYLSQVKYSCFPGHQLVGRAELTCDVDERWNGPPPRCEPIGCLPPQPIINGVVEVQGSEVYYGTTIIYNCHEGYRLIGPSKIRCLDNGQYDAPPPQCAKDSDLVTIITPKTIPTRSRSRTPRPPPTTIKGLSDLPRITTTSRPKKFYDLSSKSTSTVVFTGHPQDNTIPGISNEVHREEEIDLNIPQIIGEDRKEPFGARLNVGAVIALGAFGAFIFLAAIITTVVILVRRNQSAKHYRHNRASPDSHTIASFDSSGSESRHGGLNRYYRQAWQNLHDSQHNHAPLRRKETLDEPQTNHRDSAEMVVAEKKRHHHHHHHHNKEWSGSRQPHKKY